MGVHAVGGTLKVAILQDLANSELYKTSAYSVNELSVNQNVELIDNSDGFFRLSYAR